ncbi:MAG TPA: tetratricopeptide repeat protein [Longimicrobiaceae bacterium]|nr:tetratricopeptide repeat protein [Longimicrobiaceae bacterium]
MTRQPSTLQSLFAEMKRRRVFRVMAVYGAVAFIVLQAADLVFPMLALPEWTIRLVLGLALLGFPLAIVLAWAFETTPEGVRRTEPAKPEEIRELVAQPRSRRWPAGFLALAGMALLFATGWWMGAGRGGDSAAPNLLVPEARAAEFRTLAALPFRNVNGDDDNGIIAVGIHEDLLSQLSRIAALRVTSRTSVEEYANIETSLRKIAEELGVEYLLEGSVQSSGPRVRVRVRLVDAATDRGLWSKDFDQEVSPENLFDIQSEIARTVVDELEAQLTPEESATLAAMTPASSSVAQQWYYRGLATYAAGGMANVPRARDAFAQAVEIDPEYVAAWARLAQFEARLVFVGNTGDEAARAAMLRTQELAPGSVEAHLARGYYEYYSQRNFDAALSAFRAAERLAPSDADAVWAVGLILRRQGDWSASTEMIKRAARLDPRNPHRLDVLFENLTYQGAFEDAEAVAERALSIDPTNAKARAWKVRLAIQRDGRTDRARRLAGELRLDPRDSEEAVALAELAIYDRDWDRLLELGRTVETEGVRLLELLTGSWRAYALTQLGRTHGATQVTDSLLALATSSTLSPGGVAAYRGRLHAWAGRAPEAFPALREADRRLRESEDRVSATYWAFAVVRGYGAIGELDAGFDLMTAFVERPGNGFASTDLRLSPDLDPYRADPRFAELVERRERFEAEGARLGEAGRPWLP